jgi:NADH-quinone oxidoreductase subunit I
MARFADILKGVREWWADLRDSAVSIAKGLEITWRYMWRPTITELYPYTAPKFRARFRGFHTFNWEACIGCYKCVEDCPVDCIEMETVGKGKNVKVLKYAIDYSRCIFCALCEDACPTDLAKPHFVKSIAMGQVHDLSGYSRKDVYVDFVDLAKRHRKIVVTADLKRKAPPPGFAALPPVTELADLVREREGAARPSEARPAEARPAEARPAEARPAETRPATVLSHPNAHSPAHEGVGASAAGA